MNEIMVSMSTEELKKLREDNRRFEAQRDRALIAMQSMSDAHPAHKSLDYWETNEGKALVRIRSTIRSIKEEL